jgi:hypothetical protein
MSQENVEIVSQGPRPLIAAISRWRSGRSRRNHLTRRRSGSSPNRACIKQLKGDPVLAPTPPSVQPTASEVLHRSLDLLGEIA